MLEKASLIKPLILILDQKTGLSQPNGPANTLKGKPQMAINLHKLYRWAYYIAVNTCEPLHIVIINHIYNELLVARYNAMFSSIFILPYIYNISRIIHVQICL